MTQKYVVAALIVIVIIVLVSTFLFIIARDVTAALNMEYFINKDDAFMIYGNAFYMLDKDNIKFVKGDRLINTQLESMTILVVHNSDETIDSRYLDILDDDNLLKMYCQNANIVHPKIALLPIGIANPEWLHGDKQKVSEIRQHHNAKEMLVYANFNVGTHASRQVAAVKWLTSSPRTTFNEYLIALSKHKYCICPRGNGLDTHRYWESLYVGTIPIVLNDGSPFYIYLRKFDLPTLYVTSWDDVTPALLEREYPVMQFKFKTLDMLSPLHIGHHLNLIKHSIVLVHLGLEIVTYVKECVRQARVFNRCRIILVVDSNKEHYKSTLREFNVQVILVDPTLYDDYTRTSALSDGFWKRCSQRFFALSQIADRMSLDTFFHMENDIMLYQNLDDIVNQCAVRFSSCIGATFDNSDRGIPGFMYFANPRCVKTLCDSIMRHPMDNDMQALRVLQRECPECILSLPIVPRGHEEYSDGSDFFGCVFDAAYIGQYIAGTDQGHGPGFVNTDCVVKSSELTLSWQKNSEGLWRPFADGVLINNLHIHKKNLDKWSSLNGLITG